MTKDEKIDRLTKTLLYTRKIIFRANCMVGTIAPMSQQHHELEFALFKIDVCLSKIGHPKEEPDMKRYEEELENGPRH